jgi:hypothetical protein
VDSGSPVVVEPTDDETAPEAPAPQDAGVAAAPLDAGPGPMLVEASPSVDAGTHTVEGPLPVDADNPVLIINDLAVDNWFGEHALLAASAGQIDLVGIVVNTSEYSPDLDTNRTGWRSLIDAARASGLQNVPDLVAGVSEPLEAPDNEDVDSAQPRGSVGAQFIVEAANQYGTAELPLAVIIGGPLTDIADAYLLDPSVADRMVVVAAMGWEDEGGVVVMGGPNGELDTWAGAIVAQRIPFVQVSGFYDQTLDVTEALVDQLPDNPFGEWMASKLPTINNPAAADHVALLSVLVTDYATAVRSVGYAGRNEWGEALLEARVGGCCQYVSEVDATRAGELLWERLDDPSTFNP